MQLSECQWPVLLSAALAVLYVSSLYVWRCRLPRDHPDTVRRRFISVLLVALVSPLLPLLFRQFGAVAGPLASTASLWQVMGLRCSGLLPALLLPYLLTAVLFMGPLVQQFMQGHSLVYLQPMYWRAGLRDIIWLRNHVVAPLSEELTFRACLVPVLSACLDSGAVCVVAPLFFGVAHLHHLAERLYQRQPLLSALAISGFQFVYTSVFGCYSAYLFVRTGHFAAPFVAHAFCNHMGFPDVASAWAEPSLGRRLTLLTAYVTGLVLWCLLLAPLTQPSLYENTLYYAA